MYHSIYFAPSPEVFQSGIIDKNETDRQKVIDIWEDWHLVSSSRPLFLPPKLKDSYVDIPGGDGALDLSEVLTGTPVYSNRTGSWDLYVMNGYWDWVDAYSTIMNYLHGQRMYAILEDDKAHYYEGRFTVNTWRSDPSYSRITINYNVDPYKYTVLQNEWYWNPFDFGAPLDDNINTDADYGQWLEANRKGNTALMGHTYHHENTINGVDLLSPENESTARISANDFQLAFGGGAIPDYQNMTVAGTLETVVKGIGKKITPTFEAALPSTTVNSVTYVDTWNYSGLNGKTHVGWQTQSQAEDFRVGDYAPVKPAETISEGMLQSATLYLTIDGTTYTIPLHTEANDSLNSGAYALFGTVPNTDPTPKVKPYVICVPNELSDTPAGTYFKRESGDTWTKAELTWTQTPDTTYGVTVQQIYPDGTSTERFQIPYGGKVYIPGILIVDGANTLIFRGCGTVTMNYRGASL